MGEGGGVGDGMRRVSVLGRWSGRGFDGNARASVLLHVEQRR
jgi:hypothetical protein